MTVPVLPRRVASVYQLRSQANAALHNDHDAYADMSEYMRRSTAANDVERTRQEAALRARFATDREIERHVLLKHELDLSREQSQRQARQLRGNTIVVALGVLVIALLVYFLMANPRYRQQLVKLASQDGLTGLLNRRRTAERPNSRRRRSPSRPVKSLSPSRSSTWIISRSSTTAAAMRQAT